MSFPPNVPMGVRFAATMYTARDSMQTWLIVKTVGWGCDDRHFETQRNSAYVRIPLGVACHKVMSDTAMHTDDAKHTHCCHGFKVAERGGKNSEGRRHGWVSVLNGPVCGNITPRRTAKPLNIFENC